MGLIAFYHLSTGKDTGCGCHERRTPAQQQAVITKALSVCGATAGGGGDGGGDLAALPGLLRQLMRLAGPGHRAMVLRVRRRRRRRRGRRRRRAAREWEGCRQRRAPVWLGPRAVLCILLSRPVSKQATSVAR